MRGSSRHRCDLCYDRGRRFAY